MRVRTLPVAIALIVCLVGSIGCGFGGPKSPTGAVLGSASGALLAAAAGGGVTGILGAALLGTGKLVILPVDQGFDYFGAADTDDDGRLSWEETDTTWD
jgi:hypothetical protein